MAIMAFGTFDLIFVLSMTVFRVAFNTKFYSDKPIIDAKSYSGKPA